MSEQRLSELAEELAVVLTQGGMQRMAARMLAAFIFADRPSLTMGELGEQLGTTAGTVSDTLKTLTSVRMVEMVPAPESRRRHYRLRPGAWQTMVSTQNTVVAAMIDGAEKGVAATTPDNPAHQRLSEMRDFYTFMLREIPKLIQRWEKERGDTR